MLIAKAVCWKDDPSLPNLCSLFHNFVGGGVSELQLALSIVYWKHEGRMHLCSNQHHAQGFREVYGVLTLWHHLLFGVLLCKFQLLWSFQTLFVFWTQGMTRVLSKSPLPMPQSGNSLRMVNWDLTYVSPFRAFAWPPIPVIRLLHDNRFPYFVWSFCSFSKWVKLCFCYCKTL